LDARRDRVVARRGGRSHAMNRILTVIGAAAAAAIVAAAAVLLLRPAEPPAADSHAAGMAAEPETGPHGGRLLQDGGVALEITIFENGLPPEWRLFAYRDGEPLPPAAFDVVMELQRLGGQRETYRFFAEQDYLRGEPAV